ncbi:MAG: fatty acid desaturase [Deltaproteobacteria bacterium]|nr:fatty acid desaturase [Deltaproteobacteria bacterium]
MLRHRADLRTLAFVATYFALVATGYLLRPTHPLAIVALVVVTCCFSFFGAVITHNTIHAPVFRSRPLNRMFQVVLTMTYGHPVSSFVPGHNLSHHRYTQSRRDVMRTSKVRFRWHLLNGLFFMFRMGPDIMRSDAKYGAAMRTRKPAWFRQMLLELTALYLALGALLWLDWRCFLLYVFVPHRYAGWGIITMNLLQHDGCDEHSEYNHSRNFVGRLVNWFSFNNGYHTIHHMQAGLHWSLLPAAHAERVAPFIHPALDQKSLLGYLVRTFVWPGRRLTFDGKTVVLLEEGPDEDWNPHPDGTPAEVSLGAIS